MASVEVKSNADQVFKTIEADLLGLLEIETFRPMMINLIDMMKERIHKNGQASDESQIGTYSPGYMAVRTGIFKSNDTFSKGSNKGQTKPEGVFTKGANKGKPRPKYNRDSSTKIVVSLTSNLENHWQLIATDNGYDIGFIDASDPREAQSGQKKIPTNYEKARFVEEVKHKAIFDLSPTELAYIDEFVSKAIDEILK